jgi:hypothetical protein
VAIPSEKVKKIQTNTINLGELIVGMNPVTPKEWDAFNKLVDAHKNLMKIDTSELLQGDFGSLLKKKGRGKARPDCPRCGGTGAYVDKADPNATSRVCNCRDVDDKAWPKVKKEWEEALAPAAS